MEFPAVLWCIQYKMVRVYEREIEVSSIPPPPTPLFLFLLLTTGSIIWSNLINLSWIVSSNKNKGYFFSPSEDVSQELNEMINI